MVIEQMSIFDLVGQLNKDPSLNELSEIDESDFEEFEVKKNEPSYANTTEDLNAVLSAFALDESDITFEDEIIDFTSRSSKVNSPFETDVIKVSEIEVIDAVDVEQNKEKRTNATLIVDESTIVDADVLTADETNVSSGIYKENGDVVKADKELENVTLITDTSKEDTPAKAKVIILASKRVKKSKKIAKSIKMYAPSSEDFPTTPVARLEANLDAIRLLSKVESEGYTCSSKDLSILGRFTGWGGLGEFFEIDNKRNAELLDVLGEHYESAATSVTTGYYTPPEVIKFKFELLKRFGFEKGRILDCSAGIGRYFTYMNKSIYEGSKLYGVELDYISSKISSLLHPKANIINSAFEKTAYEDEYFDLCISNIPFGDLLVYDNQDTELNKLKLKIHDYFFVKALKKVRVGGMVAFITSSGFMDKHCTKVRELIGKEAELLGAFRLPNDTFTGTKVVSDIVIFKRTKTHIENDSWLDVVPLESLGDDYNVNKYFVENSELVCGVFSLTSSQYGKALTVSGEEINEKNLKSKLRYFPSDVYVPRVDESYLYEQDELITDEALYELECSESHPWINDLRDDEYVCIDDVLYKKESSYLVRQKENMAKYSLIKDYALVKGALLDICTNNDADDTELKLMQDELNYYYDKFVKEHGHINKSSNVTVLSKDKAGFPRVSALEDVTEVYDEKENKLIKIYNKADIFTQRTVGRSAVVKKPTTLQEAILLSFSLIGKLDINLMAERLEQPYTEVLNGCIENNLIFYDFELGKYEDSRDFLSGYVKDKLKYHEYLLNSIEQGNTIITVPIEREAFLVNFEESCKYISEIKRNIEALKENQPEFEENVEFGISSTWIPLDIKRKFLVDTLNLGSMEQYLKLEYNEKIGYQLSGCILNRTLRTVEWGTTRVDAERIIVHALNDTAPTVKDKLDNTEYVNVEQTQLAVSKVNKWISEFKDYVFNNPDLHLEIVQIYNDLFVRTKEKEQINFIHDPETNPNIKLRECQLKGVSRCITAKTSQLLFYETGVGKTFTMQVLAYMKYKMRMQEEGRPNKTVIVVPNSLALSGQFAREFLKLYPNAKVLGLTPKDFEKKNRRKVLSKIATNNWHAVIIPHSVLDLIPLKSETLKKYYEQDIRDMKAAIYNYEKSYDRRSVFKMEKMISNRKAQMESLLDIQKDSDSIYWEDLGVDDIMVDEAHHFKSLFFVTKKERIAGISNRASKCASNLYNIVRYQQEKNPASVTFATATPITNTIGELFNFSRYLNADGLRRRGVFEFDAWASTFGSVVNEVETDVTGRGFKMKPRFAKFYNIPELMQIVKEFADVVFTEDVAEIEVPKLVTGKPINIEVEPTGLMEEAIQILVELVGMYESNTDDIRKSYNMLKICGEGRKLAVSPKLLSSDEAYEPLRNVVKAIHQSKELSPKLKAVIDKAYEIYLKHPDMGQVIFCDIGVPKNNEYSAYQEMKDGLIAKGLSEDEIVFIHDCGDSPIKRQEVIKKFNDGLIKVLIGSTSKMGVGVNMQKRLVALHHVDSCWLPSDIKQREGRILRSGNINKEVYIFRYLVKNSFDVFSWQTLERKANFIHQITSGAKDLRSVDDLGSESISYAEAKAAASGNPLLLEHCSLVSKYNELKVQEKNYSMMQVKNKNRINDLTTSISTKKRQLDILRKEIDSIESYDTFRVVFSRSGIEYTNKETILEVIKNTPKFDKLGYIYGLPVKFDSYLNQIKIGESNLVDFSMVTHHVAIYKRLEDVVKTMQDALSETTNLIDAYEKELEFLEDYIKKPFDLREELLDIEKRKTDIETELYSSGKDQQQNSSNAEDQSVESEESKEGNEDDVDIEHLSDMPKSDKLDSKIL